MHVYAMVHIEQDGREHVLGPLLEVPEEASSEEIVRWIGRGSDCDVQLLDDTYASERLVGDRVIGW